jgi:hypothetical protein
VKVKVMMDSIFFSWKLLDSLEASVELKLEAHFELMIEFVTCENLPISPNLLNKIFERNQGRISQQNKVKIETPKFLKEIRVE